MKCTVIGSFGAYPEAHNPASGYLIEENNTKILLDCGSGVLSRLQEQLPLYELDAAVLSHYHSDHCADLGCLQYAVMIDKQLGRRTKSFSAWGPGDVPRLAYKEFCTGRSYLEHSFFQIGEVTFETCRNGHDIPSFALKITGKSGKTLVYSGDTGYYAGLADFARDADFFLCEASFYEYQRGFSGEHLTSAEAGEIAEQAGVKRLILTHLPHYGTHSQLIREAALRFSGEILLAESGLILE